MYQFNTKKKVKIFKYCVVSIRIIAKCNFSDDNNSNNKIIRSMWNHDHNIIMSIVSHAIISLIVCLCEKYIILQVLASVNEHYSSIRSV